mmetsp:Transcript_48754/g.121763  ORF Transcript_48754/g.121763 Transcript_48754/m.121763 type:complete len:226 (-) Transcript_48754:498-1175(-)
MWCFALRASQCWGARPVKANMPICDVMWFHEVNLALGGGHPMRLRAFTRADLISTILWDMSVSSCCHMLRRESSPSTPATRRAPCSWGLEYMGRMMPLSWLLTFPAVSSSAHATLSAPILSPYSPKFLEYDCVTISSSPLSSLKYRTAYASLSRSPVAYPWYAVSKMMTARFFSQTSAIRFHWSGVGSTPVGLCATVCSTKTLPRGAPARSWSIPSMSSPIWGVR